MKAVVLCSMIRFFLIVAMLALARCEDDGDAKSRVKTLQDWWPQYLPSFQPIDDTWTIQVPAVPRVELIQPIAPINVPMGTASDGCVGTVHVLGNSVVPCP